MKTDREIMDRGLTHAAWGYFLLHFDFNLGTVSILPAFAGYLLLLTAIRDLSGERRDLALLRTLGIGLTVWSAADWLLSWTGRSFSGMFLPLDLIVAVAGLYFHFQLITDMAALAAQHQPEGKTLDRWLLRCRTVYVVLTTATHLLLHLPEGVFDQAREFVLVVLVITQLITALCIMAGLFDLRRIFREPEETPRQPEA